MKNYEYIRTVLLLNQMHFPQGIIFLNLFNYVKLIKSIFKFTLEVGSSYNVSYPAQQNQILFDSQTNEPREEASSLRTSSVKWVNGDYPATLYHNPKTSGWGSQY